MSLPTCIVLATDLAPRTDRAQDRAVTLARAWRAMPKLVAQARAPVLVVKKRGIPPYARVIVGSDLSDASVAALETALALFQPSQITLYHAFDMPYRGLIADTKAYEANARATALNEARAFASQHFGTAADSLNIEVGFGDAAPCIAECATRAEADLVLAGTHGRTGLIRVLLGSVALALMNDVPCDVMIVPSKGARSTV